MSAPSSRISRRHLLVAAVGVAAGVAIRIALSFAAEGKSWSDSAIIALMAMHALRGRFYTFYWGQDYMGSIESLGVALFFALFGIRDATLSMGLLPWYVLFAIALFVLARRAGGPLAGVFAVWLLAFSPPYVQYQQIMPRGDYPETLAFGTILLCLTLRITHDRLAPELERRYLLAIGLVAGVAFWTNWLVFPYFAVVAIYLLLHDWRLPFRPVLLPTLAAFFLGGLPFWIHNIRHGFPTFSFVADVQTPESRRAALHYAVSTAIPVLCGFRDLYEKFTWGWPGKLLTGAATAATIALVIGLRRSWWAIVRGRVRDSHPLVALLLLTVAMVAIYSVGLPGRFHVPRYLLPIVTATLTLGASAIAWLAGRSRIAAGAVLALLLLVYAAQIVDFGRGLAAPGDRPGAGPHILDLVDSLDREGIRFGYAEYGDATLATYVARERFVLTDYAGARYPLDEVDFHDPAVIVRDSADPADGTLATLNASFAAKRIPGYVIYSPIRYDGVSRAPLSRRAWKVSASEDADEAPQLIDGDRWTYWSVPAAKLGAAVTIDLGAVETVTGLHFDLGERGYDAFARLRVESSLDGAEWTLVKTAEWGFPLRFDPRGQITTVAQRSQMVLFEPRAARWLRLTLVANFAKYDWSIGELTVFGRGEGDVVLRPPEFADPASPALAERRLYLQSLREPGNDGPLVELRRLYRSLGDLEKLRDVERLEAERFRPAIATDWRFGRDLKLLGYDWRATGARTVQVTYYWQAMRAIDDDYAAYLHFEDGVQGLQDDYLPGSPRTTSRWRAEEIVKDVRVLRVPAGVTDGSYPARLGVWIPSQKRQVRRGRYGGLGWWGAKATTLFHLDVAGDRVTVRSGT